MDTPINAVCGPGSFLSGTTLLTFGGGSLLPGGRCVFSTQLRVPSGSPTGTFTNVTSPLDASVGGAAISGGAAQASNADLTIVSAIPTLSLGGLALLLSLLFGFAVRRLRSTSAEICQSSSVFSV